MGYIINFEKASNFDSVSQGDSIHIPIEPDYENFVVIQGQIKNQGKYPYNQ